MASNFLQRRFHLADEVLSRLLKLYQPYVQTIHNIYCMFYARLNYINPACMCVPLLFALQHWPK